MAIDPVHNSFAVASVFQGRPQTSLRHIKYKVRQVPWFPYRPGPVGFSFLLHGLFHGFEQAANYIFFRGFRGAIGFIQSSPRQPTSPPVGPVVLWPRYSSPDFVRNFVRSITAVLPSFNFSVDKMLSLFCNPPSFVREREAKVRPASQARTSLIMAPLHGLLRLPFRTVLYTWLWTRMH